MGTLDMVVSKEVMLSNKFGNIKIWKSTMKSILMKEDLWDLVDGLPAPAKSSSKDKGKTNMSEESATYMDKVRKRKQKAKSIFELSVDIDLRIHVEDKNEPRITWKNLFVLFQTNTITNTMLTLSR